MDPNSIIFIVLLVAMSGYVAYIADIVGKKLGKKRLSIFGLRPRHTATLGTVLVGVVISTFTIAVVLIASSDMRQSLLEGSKIRKQLAEEQKELAKLEGEMKTRALQNSDLTKSNGLLTRTISDKTKELAQRRADLQTAQAKLTELNFKLGSLQARVGTLQADVSRKQIALVESDKNLKAAQANLKRVQVDLKSNKTRLKNVENDNGAIERKNAELTNKNDELLSTQKKLTADLDRIKVEVSDLQMAEKTAQSSLAQSQSQLRDASSELASVQSKLASTLAELHDAEVNYERYKFITGVSRNQPLIFKVGEEIVRLTVPPNLSVNAARGAVLNLIRRAQAEAHHRGAQKHAYPEAAIVDHTDPQTGQTITPEMIESSIIKQITGSATRKVLIATSSLNAFFGESVSLEVEILPDPLVYLGGQLVAEKVIDGSRGDAAIYDEIRTFLQDTVKSRAQRDGMIPLANSDTSFGQIPPADLFQVIEQLHNANRTIRLQAHATGDTYAADPLKLEFRLR